MHRRDIDGGCFSVLQHLALGQLARGNRSDCGNLSACRQRAIKYTNYERETTADLLTAYAIFVTERSK
jgi:hypothetical protein